MEIFDLFGIYTVKLEDIIDSLLVLFIIYQLYKVLKGSLAFTILLGIITVVIFYAIVKSLNMRMLTAILGQFISLGVIGLLIVFQQEVRKFLLMIGKNSMMNNKISLVKLLPWNWKPEERSHQTDYRVILDSCRNMAAGRTGAIIIVASSTEMKFVGATGEQLDAILSRRLLESIFAKNSPLHDGAVIVAHNKITAAGCVLPVSENPDLDPQLGLRHRAAIGISEQSDAISIVVSEETGGISIASQGQIFHELTDREILKMLAREIGPAANSRK
jgi:diadenylate cyclase